MNDVPSKVAPRLTAPRHVTLLPNKCECALMCPRGLWHLAQITNLKSQDSSIG